jgi:hypothetical protein
VNQVYRRENTVGETSHGYIQVEAMSGWSLSLVTGNGVDPFCVFCWKPSCPMSRSLMVRNQFAMDELTTGD